VRLAATHLDYEEVRPRMKDLVTALFSRVPCGVGAHGAIRKLSKGDLSRVAVKGAAWPVEMGYGFAEDLTNAEANGCVPGADPDRVTERAVERGVGQLGTLGSGNHFLEVDVVDEIFDERVAAAFGLRKGQVTIFIHSGSRGFGYQTCDDYLKTMQRAVEKYKIHLPDRQLACTPIESPEGQAYLAAMNCAANYAWANRQTMMHLARQTFLDTLQMSPRDLGFRLVYDVAHNIAKFEEHEVDGRARRLCVHRKGATRAFPPGHPQTPASYQHVGQPVMIPGDMGTASFVCCGTQRAMEETFGSSAHGAGRVLSRTAAKKQARGRAIHRELEDRGIFVRSTGRETLAEEMSEAYKDVEMVAEVTHRAGVTTKVARLRPAGVIKG
jgi:tRNA-splicing ligase RtcB